VTGRDDLVYMDFAATAAIRPPVVSHAVASFLDSVGATAGRGAHRLSIEAGRLALQCRQRIARLLGIPGDPGRIAFMFNATHALNTAIAGTVRRGNRVVVTSFDHNAVLRPVHRLVRERHIDVRLVPGLPDGTLDEAVLDAALDGARLLSINAASNVLGSVLPIRELVGRAHAAGALALVDAAQAAGHVPLDVAACGADLVAFSGHKGLLGPQGTGVLWVRDGLDVEPLLAGGTGGDSTDRGMPVAYPDHLEAGTQNTPGIAGLAAGVEWLSRQGVAEVHARGAALNRRLWTGLSGLGGIHVHSPLAADGIPIVTITADGLDPATLAARLDGEHGVLTRPGLHCAPEAHRVLGTADTGAVRFSLGWCTSQSDVDRAIDAVDRVVNAGRVFASAGAPGASSGDRVGRRT
jgi:cysteine desulfurase family protein